MSSRQSSLEDRIEAAGVLAQITSPWISDNHKIQKLDAHVPSMVSSLTGLARLNGDEETFLLVTAALANLTFMSPVTSAAMRRNNTVRTLVKAVKASPFTTLFAKDQVRDFFPFFRIPNPSIQRDFIASLQVVTVLANMAASASCRPEIHSVDGVTFLLGMLETKAATENMTQAETAAAERVQKKAAIALSRSENESAKVNLTGNQSDLV